VHIECNVWAEAAEPLFDVAGLLTRKFGMIAIGVKVCRQRTLKVYVCG
jgi:hypothetical protein